MLTHKAPCKWLKGQLTRFLERNGIAYPDKALKPALVLLVLNFMKEVKDKNIVVKWAPLMGSGLGSSSSSAAAMPQIEATRAANIERNRRVLAAIEASNQCKHGIANGEF